MTNTAIPTTAGVLGSGDVGRILARGLADHGLETTLGTRRPDDPDLQAWAQETGITISSLADAAHAGEVIVLAVRGASDALGGALDGAGVSAFDGKVVIDVTNPLVSGGEGLPPALEIGHTDSGGEHLQRRLPRARVVKAFNTVGNALMVDPDLPVRPTMFIAGNDEDAKGTVAAILDAFGWDALDVGHIERSRELESLCVLWVAIGIKHGYWDHAITLVRP